MAHPGLRQAAEDKANSSSPKRTAYPGIRTKLKGSANPDDLPNALSRLAIKNNERKDEKLAKFGFSVVGEKSLGLRPSQTAVLSSLLLKRRILENRKKAHAEKRRMLKEVWREEDEKSAANQPSTAQVLSDISQKRAQWTTARDDLYVPEAKDEDDSHALNAEQRKRVANSFALSARNPDKTLVDAFKIELSNRDFLTLGPRKWLNDNVIDLYLNIVVSSLATHKSAVFTTHFFTKLQSEGYSAVRRWAIRKKLDVFAPDYVFVPVNQNNVHWSLAVIDNKRKELGFYDSLPSGKGRQELEVLKGYMKGEAKRLGRPENIVDAYKLNPNVSAPKQSNGYDCGVFMCEVVHRLAKGLPLKHSQRAMPSIREYMANAILETADSPSKL